MGITSFPNSTGTILWPQGSPIRPATFLKQAGLQLFVTQRGIARSITLTRQPIEGR